MNTLDTPLGWLFVSLAVIFALGLVPRFARRFYPASPNFLSRLVAPLIFSGLALACFLGVAVPALSTVVVLGMALILVSRRQIG